jgi:hypothetical protein
MRFLQTFSCPVFALNNSLTSSKAILQWDPRARLGLNLGPSPMHACNVHVVLSLTAGLMSPQFHFNDVFETCKYGVTDAGLASTWQGLVGFKRGSLNEPVLHTSEGLLGHSQILHTSARAAPQVPMECDTFSFLEVSDTNSAESKFYEDNSVTFSDAPPSVPCQVSCVTPQASHMTREASLLSAQPSAQRNPTRMPRNALNGTPSPSQASLKAETSLRGQNCTMSHTMVESVSNQSFFGPTGMHYMSACATTTGTDDGQTTEDHLHDKHLALQDHMSNPIAFHAEMLGNIMFLNQTLKQPDASNFVKAIITEVNGHVNNKHWQLTKQSEVPPDVNVLPSVWSLHCKQDITTIEIKKYKSSTQPPWWKAGIRNELLRNFCICCHLVLHMPVDCHWHSQRLGPQSV